jgi:hypothetical protein
MGITGRRNPGDALREEIQQEKAAVLGRAGETLARVLAELQGAGKRIDERIRFLEQLSMACRDVSPDHPLLHRRRCAILDINERIDTYNQLREHARLRYYYLIVTREAMGLRRHDRVKELFVMPGKRKHLHADHG